MSLELSFFSTRNMCVSDHGDFLVFDGQKIIYNNIEKIIVIVAIVSQLVATKRILQNRPDQKVSRFITPKHSFM